MGKKPTAAPATPPEDQTKAVPAPEAVAAEIAAAAPEAAAAETPAAPEAVAALQETVKQLEIDTASPPIIPVPSELEFMVKAKVLDPLIHDGVTYAAGSVVNLTPDQHRDLVRAGVVSDELAEALPY